MGGAGGIGVVRANEAHNAREAARPSAQPRTRATIHFYHTPALVASSPHALPLSVLASSPALRPRIVSRSPSSHALPLSVLASSPALRCHPVLLLVSPIPSSPYQSFILPVYTPTPCPPFALPLPTFSPLQTCPLDREHASLSSTGRAPNVSVLLDLRSASPRRRPSHAERRIHSDVESKWT
eukprot:2400054-Pleurochrysis_carterae.AAC.1